MRINFENKHFLMTGGSSGIGAAIVDCLISEGASVTCLSRSVIDKEGVEHIECDLSDLGKLSHILNQVSSGIRELDGLILVGGYGDFGSLEEFSDKRIQTLINVNLTSLIMICRKFIPVLKKARKGDILLMGSEAALQGGKKGAVYCATKFALRGFSQSLREECRSNDVRVSLINPGMVKTPFFNQLDFTPGTDVNNFITPDEVAESVLYVLSRPSALVVDEINLSPLKSVIRNKQKYE